MDQPISDYQPPIEPSITPPEQLPQILQIPSKKSSIPSIILGVVIIILLGGMGYFAYQYFTLKNQLAVAPAPTPSPTIETTDPTADWKKYESEYGFSFKYPADVEIHEADRIVSVSKWGPTQKTETEFYDGLLVSFGVQNLENDSIESWVNKAIDQASVMYEIKQKSKNTQLNNYAGYSYITSSNPNDYTTTILQIPHDKTKIIQITNSTNDPTNQGYKKIADIILSTFKFTNEIANAQGVATITTEKLPQVAFPSISISYPKSWSIKQETDHEETLDLELSKQGYVIKLWQAPMGGGACLFDDSPQFDGPSSDYRLVKYTEIQMAGNTYRIFKPVSNANSYSLCEKSNDGLYQSPTIGDLGVTGPSVPNDTIFQEVITILQSIKIN